MFMIDDTLYTVPKRLILIVNVKVILISTELSGILLKNGGVSDIPGIPRENLPISCLLSPISR